jgi:hypothetical protein
VNEYHGKELSRVQGNGCGKIVDLKLLTRYTQLVSIIN